MKILIAEDSAMGRLLLRRAVEGLGHECLVADDGTRAWELFREQGADVVISDWLMPGMEGPELCRRVRESEGPYAYFVFLTVLRDKQHALQGVRAGADDYLTKPLEPAELHVCLIAAERVVALHRGLAEKTTALERAYHELYETARTDALTGVGNRLRLLEDLKALEARAERYGHSYCVALCDVDQFKAYNDRYGHPAGDRVLREVATILAKQCRGGDAVYRYGGEEFAIVMPEQSPASATVGIERIARAVRAAAIPHAENEGRGILTISAGVACRRPHATNAGQDILDRADAALYRAKQAGRDRVEQAPEPTLAPA